jgi:hypothetical protein
MMISDERLFSSKISICKASKFPTYVPDPKPLIPQCI